MNFTERALNVIIYGMMRTYGEWLGPEYHVTRTPKEIDGWSSLITFSIDPTEKPYMHWLNWQVHGLDQVYTFRAKWASHEILETEIKANGELDFSDAMVAVSVILKDIHDELNAFTVREGWASNTLHIG